MSVNIFDKSTGSIAQIAGNATGGGGTTVTVDNILSTTSENPVQNKIITEELNKKANQTTVDSALSLKADSADVAASLAEKSDIGHTHDDRYYTESETNTLLNEKANKSDIPTTLPANGGNAETLGGLHVNEIASNPNLLINPDFKINQRGLTTYTSKGYAFDRWYLDTSDGASSLSAGDNGLTYTISNPTAWNEIRQVIIPDVAKSLNGKTVTMSTMIDGILYYGTASNLDIAANYAPISIMIGDVQFDLRSYPASDMPINLYVRIGSKKDVVLSNIEYVKLELGSVATPFVPPDPAAELLKCQRYFIRLKNAFGWIGSGFTNKTLARCVIPLPTTMRISPTVTLNGKIYANTPTSLKERAIECTTVRSDISYAQNAIGAGFDLPEGSTSIEPCFMQFRDSESYIDISAEL